MVEINKNNQIKLDYYQIMIFLWKLDRLKNENDFIVQDGVVFEFYNYALEKISEALVKNKHIDFDEFKELKIFSIPSEVYQLLTEITSFDPVDSTKYIRYKNFINKIDKIREKNANKDLNLVANRLVSAKILKKKNN